MSIGVLTAFVSTPTTVVVKLSVAVLEVSLTTLVSIQFAPTAAAADIAKIHIAIIVIDILSFFCNFFVSPSCNLICYRQFHI
jgi:hypothetical protein